LGARTDYLRRMWEADALLVRPQPFTLKSNRESYVYANHRNLVCNPEDLRLLADLILETAKGSFPDDFALCTVDSSVSPFLVAAASVRGDVPFYNYRGISREQGVGDLLFGY
jgi:orotate phosphoribosyltransferase